MNKYVIIFTLTLLIGLSKGFEYKDYKEVMRGFLMGIGVKEMYLDHLLGCLTDQKDVEVKFIETLDKIDRLDFTNLPATAELFADLYDIVIMSVVEIDLCANDNDEYDHLFRRIYSLMNSVIVKRLMLNFISNHQQIFKDIQDAIDNYHGQKFKQLGIDLGDITNPTPAGFPRVQEDAQKARDGDRRHILEQELAAEQRNLEQARKELAGQQSAGVSAERLTPYRDRVGQHERNIQAIQKELGNLK